VAGTVELVLQVGLRDLQTMKRHTNVFVPHEFFSRWQTNPAAEHRCRHTPRSFGEIGQRDAQV
jgi:hypothetical protein